MTRLLLLLVFVVSVIATVFLLRKLWNKLSHLVTQTLQKGSDLALQQKKKWKQRKKRKKLPNELQQLIVKYEAFLESNSTLSEPWQQALQPVYTTLGDIVRILSTAPKKRNKVRPLFSVSLPALEKFINTIQAEQKLMNDTETEKARHNIDVIYNDLQQHEAKEAVQAFMK